MPPGGGAPCERILYIPGGGGGTPGVYGVDIGLKNEPLGGLRSEV